MRTLPRNPQRAPRTSGSHRCNLVTCTSQNHPEALPSIDIALTWAGKLELVSNLVSAQLILPELRFNGFDGIHERGSNRLEYVRAGHFRAIGGSVMKFRCRCDREYSIAGGCDRLIVADRGLYNRSEAGQPRKRFAQKLNQFLSAHQSSARVCFMQSMRTPVGIFPFISSDSRAEMNPTGNTIGSRRELFNEFLDSNTAQLMTRSGNE